MTASDDDDTLLAAVAGGDRLALRKLYTTYHGRLFRFLMRVTHDAQLAEEILNDTLWIVWRGASGFRGQSRVSTWIMGIAYRRALKALSTLKRQDRLSGTSLDSAEGGDFAEVSVESVAQSIETEDWIDSALESLSPEHRLTIELAYFAGESCEDIALITGCPVGTVKTRLHHARIRMQRHLARQDRA